MTITAMVGGDFKKKSAFSHKLTLLLLGTIERQQTLHKFQAVVSTAI